MKAKSHASKSRYPHYRYVNEELLAASIKLSRKLAKAGIRTRPGYCLPSPFDQQLVRTSPVELLARRVD